MRPSCAVESGVTFEPRSGVISGARLPANTGSVVVYSTASYPPHPTAMLYTVVAGALAFAARMTGSPGAATRIRRLPRGPRESRAGVLGWARRVARRLRGRGPELPQAAFGTRAVGGVPYRL